MAQKRRQHLHNQPHKIELYAEFAALVGQFLSCAIDHQIRVKHKPKCRTHYHDQILIF
jgi:hypothetical protein